MAEVAAAVEARALPLVLMWLKAEDSAHEKVSPAQLRAMVVLERSEGCNLTQLAHELGTIASWASRLCDRLVAAGYVERGSGGDRREVVLRLRGEGRALLADLQRRRRDLLVGTLARMTAPERRALVIGLEGFSRVASDLPGPARPGPS